MQGAFLIEAGISSSYHIAKFFGLTKRLRKPQRVTKLAAKQTKSHRKRRAAISSAPTAVGLKKH
jgi:hypothetical protein